MIDLKKIIEKNPECEKNPEQLRALLLEVYPAEKARIRILVDILKCGIAKNIKKLKSINESKMDEFITFLENDYGYSPKMVKECIECWFDVYVQPKEERKLPLNGYFKLPTGSFTVKNGVLTECTSVQKVVAIPDGVTSIAEKAFRNHSSLICIVIPDSVTSISSLAFYDCTNLIRIIIPDSVTSIGSHAFHNCNKLAYNEHENCGYLGNERNPYYALIKVTKCNSKTYTIHKDTKLIAGSAFANSSNITSIVIPNSVASIGEYAFYNCDKLKKVIIPDSVTSICKSAFDGCSSLTNVSIPNSVASIGCFAFENCSSLTSIEIPDSVTSIGGWAFCGCCSLTSIEIPDSVTSIGCFAFENCSSLTSVVIPDSVVNIGSKAFYNCNKLIYNRYENCIYLGNERNPYHVFIKVTNCDYNSYTIHKDAKLIMADAFANCSNLISISIPDNVTSIGDLAFANCDSLTSVVIPDSVTSIGYEAFYNCSSLTSIVIPSSLKSIGSKAFYYCSNLVKIYITDIAAWCNISGLSNLMWYCDDESEEFYTINSDLYLNNKLITDLVIPDSITKIDDYAFFRRYSLESVVIPNSVTDISFSAFDGCHKLSSVYFKGNDRDWNAITIYECNDEFYGWGDDIGARDNALTSATRYYYCEKKPTEEGNYWHYDKNGRVTVWEFSPDSKELKHTLNSDEKVYSAKEESKFIYCKVKFVNNLEEKSYYYLTNDESIQVGDIAVVSVGNEQKETEVKIEAVEVYSNEAKCPYPPEKTKYILRKSDKTEDLTKLQAIVNEKIKTPYGEGVIIEVKEVPEGYAVVVRITFPWGKSGVRDFSYSECCLSCSLMSGKKFPRLSISQIKQSPRRKTSTKYSVGHEDNDMGDDYDSYVEDEIFESYGMDMGYLEDDYDE